MFAFAGYFVAKATSERRRADALLLDTLPAEIVRVLKSGRKTIAEHYETSSILFCDIVGSTPLFSGMAPEEVVDWLNEIFSGFDQLVEKHGLEKIGTIGDSYIRDSPDCFSQPPTMIAEWASDRESGPEPS